MKINKYKSAFLTLLLITIPGATFAGSDCSGPLTNGIDCTRPVGLQQLGIFVGNIYDLFVAIAGPLALVAVVYSGILYMTSAGNDSRLKRAKLSLIYSLVGVALIVSSYFLVTFASVLVRTIK